jgi:hypothetical protein
MEFFQLKGSELPILKLQVIKDGVFNHLNFMEELQNARITFSMIDESNGLYKIFEKPAYIVEKKFDNPDAPDEYYIFYKWEKKDVNKSGRYVGEFAIKIHNDVLIVPINEKLYINII